MKENLLSQVLFRTATALSEEDFNGVTKICNGLLSDVDTLTTLSLPNSIMYIGEHAFGFSHRALMNEVAESQGYSCQYGTSGLTDVNLGTLNPYCRIYGYAFYGTPWYENLTGVTLAAGGKILFHTTSDVADMSIPDTVINLAGLSCAGFAANTSFVIPDTVEICMNDVFGESSIERASITKLTVGASLREIGTYFVPATVTTVIFRQPAGMEITLPTSNMGYAKSSKNMNIYTDNECIKNYNWAGDGVTATFYPLADAPA